MSDLAIEHVALNVADPTSMAAWYVAHLGLTVRMGLTEAPFTHFLADAAGRVMLEVYRNPADQVPEYAAMDPLLLHVAFTAADPGAVRERLLAAGATLVSDSILDDGSHLVMLRDPWGLAIQLCKRATPLL